jgi:hypothetical protein
VREFFEKRWLATSCDKNFVLGTLCRSQLAGGRVQFSPMTKISKVPLADTTVEVLREGVLTGRWQGKMPGQLKLAKELGVSRRTLGVALTRLAKEGVLSSAGPRKVPVILKAPPGGAKYVAGPVKIRPLRVALLIMRPLSEMGATDRQDVLEVMMNLQGSGHHGVLVVFPKGKNTRKTGYLQKLVKEASADAWLIYLGPVEILTWFVGSGLPAMALGGAGRGLRIASASSDWVVFTGTVLDRLIGLGHRRIVLITLGGARRPEHARYVVEFRRKLIEAGVHPGEYHVPDWEESPRGLGKLLDELFRVTPPTAILCWATHTVYGVQAWLKGHRLRIPEDVSVVSPLNEVGCSWYSADLRIACPIDSINALFHRRVRNWVRGVATGKPDTIQTFITLRLDEGNSIGPPRVDGAV